MKNLTVDSGAVQNGSSWTGTAGDSVVYVKDGGKLVLDAGAVLQNHLFDNTVPYVSLHSGAAVHICSGGALGMKEGSVISGGLNAQGYTGAGVHNEGDFVMDGGKITGFIATSMNAFGGGVCNGATGRFTMNGGEISGNEAKNFGGAVFLQNGEFILSGGKISGNKANKGGVHIYGGTMTVSGAPVVQENQGGNVYMKAPITVGAEGLSSGAKLGVTYGGTAPTEGSPVAITGANGADYSPYFTSDDVHYLVQNSETDNALLLALNTAPAYGEVNVEGATADGLDEMAESEKVEGSEVKITLTIKEQEDAAEVEAINNYAGKQTVDCLLDLSVLKTVTTAGVPTETAITNTSKVLAVFVPYDFTNKTNIQVYRKHGENPVESLKAVKSKPATPQDGSFYLDKTAGGVYIYASKFSTYAISYIEGEEKPTHKGGGGSASITYTITAKAGEGGKISPAGDTVVNENRQKTYTITPADGYEIFDVLVDGKSVGAVKTYVFTDVIGDHKIEAIFQKAGETATQNQFTDVKESDWFYDYVMDMNQAGLMNGTSDRLFSPAMSTTRGMIATILWRLEGKPTVENPIPFSDVAATAWYGEGVRWAAAIGVVKGYSETIFAPNDDITREQMAAMLYRFATSPDATGDLNGFVDQAKVSDYARGAMIWAVDKGIINGKEGGLLDPKGKATRAEVAAMMARYQQAK